jgi:hypothetical protein
MGQMVSKNVTKPIVVERDTMKVLKWAGDEWWG